LPESSKERAKNIPEDSKKNSVLKTLQLFYLGVQVVAPQLDEFQTQRLKVSHRCRIGVVHCSRLVIVHGCCRNLTNFATLFRGCSEGTR